MVYKQKILSGSVLEDVKELKMIELEDDVGHFTAENQELRLKLKDLSL